MKKLRKLFITTTVFLAAIISMIIGGLANSLPTVKAASPVTITFEVYKKADFEIMASFEATYGFDYETAKRETTIYEGIRDNHEAVNPYDADGEAFDYLVDSFPGSWQAAADAWWNAEYADSGSTEEDNIACNYYPSLGTGVDIVVKDGKKTKKVNALGKTYAQVKAAVQVYENIKAKTEFAPGDAIVIVPKAQSNNLGAVEVYVDLRFPNADGTSMMVDQADVNNTLRTEITTIEKPTGTPSTYTFIVNGSSVNHEGTSIGGYVTDYTEGNAVSTTVTLPCIEAKVSSTASGQYSVGVGNIDGVKHNYYDSGDGKQYDYPTNMTIKNVTVTIKGASNKSYLSGVTIGTSGSATKDSSKVTISTGANPGSYDYWTANSDQPIPSGTGTTVNVLPAEAENGTIEEVRYASKIEDCIGGTLVTKTSGTYSIPVAAAGGTTYVAVKVKSQDTTTTSWSIIAIPTESYNIAKLNSYSVTSVGGSTTTVTNSPTFSSASSGPYTIKVAADASSITFTPVFDETTYKETATVNGTAAHTGVGVSIPVATGSFSVVVTAQDGTTSKTYNFTIGTLSNDNSINFNAPGYTHTTSPDGKTFTISGVPFATNSINFSVTNSNGAKIEYNGSPITSGSTQSFAITPNGVAAASTTKTIKVTAESGLVENYTVVVNRVAANTNNDLDTTASGTKVYDNNGNEIPGTWSGNTWTASSNVDISVTGFKVKPVASSGATGLSKIKVNGTAVSSGGNSALITFGSSTLATPKSATVVVTSQAGVDQTYTINVTRRAADTDSTFTYTVIDDKGNDITSIFTDSTIAGTYQNNVEANYLDTQVKYVKITITPNTSSTVVKIGGAVYTGVPYQLNITAGTVPGYTPLTISIEPEASPKNVYFRAWSKALSQNAYLDEITATGTVDSSATNTKNPTTSDFNYSFTIDKDTNGNYYSLSVTTKSDRAKVYYTQSSTGTNDFTGAPGSPTFTGLPFVNGQILEIDKVAYLYVLAEDGTTSKIYTIDVKFTDKRDKDPTITSFKVYTTDYKGVETEYTYFAFNPSVSIQTKVQVPYSVVSLRFALTYAKPLTTLAQGNLTESLTGVTNTSYTFQSQAENTDYKSIAYQVPVERAVPNTGNDLIDIKFNGTSAPGFTSAQNTFAYLNGRNLGGVTVGLTVSPGARYTATFNSVSYQTSPFSISGLSAGSYKILTVSVESEKSTVDGTGLTNLYQIYIFNASTAVELDDIIIKAKDEYGADLEDVDGNTYTFAATGADQTKNITISYSAENPYFEITQTSAPYASVSGVGAQTINQSTSNNTTKNIVIKSTSEYGTLLQAAGFTVPADQVRSYTFKFTRNKASNVSTLTELKFIFSSSNSDKDATYNETYLLANRTLKFENLGTSPEVTIMYTKKDPTSTVEGFTDPDLGGISGSSYETFTISANSTETINVKVKSEAGTYTTYKLIFAQSDAVLDTNASITKITLEGDVVTGDILGFNPLVPSYTPTLRATNTKARVKVELASSKASLEIDGSTWDKTNVYEKALNVGGTTTITVKCLAQDPTATPTEYTITITTPDLDNDNTLKDLIHQYTGHNEQITGFDKDTTTYTVNVTNDVTSYVLVPSANSTNATVTNSAPTSSPMALNVGDNYATVTVVAENGTSKTYTVKVVRDAVLDVEPENITITTTDGTPITFTPSGPNSYTATDIPYSVNDIVVNATPEGGSNVGVQIIGATGLNPGNNQVIIRVTAASGGYQDIILNIPKEQGKTGNDITSYTTESGDALSPSEIAGTTISYIVPRDTAQFDPTYTLSDAATVKSIKNKTAGVADPTSMLLKRGEKNVFEFIVTSEVGVDKTYTINVYTTDTVSLIDDIELLDRDGGSPIADINTGLTVDYDPDTMLYNITIAYSTTGGFILVTPHTSLATVYIDSVAITSKAILPIEGNNTYTIYANSEYGEKSGDIAGRSPSYIITVIRENAKSDPRLQTLEVKVAGEVVPFMSPFDPDGNYFAIENVGDGVTSIIINGTPIEPSTNVVGLGNKSLNATASVNATYAIECTAESGATHKYEIEISRGPLNLDDDNNINYIEFKDSIPVTHIDENTVWSDPKVQNVTVGANVTTVNIIANNAAGSPATIIFKADGVIKQSSDTNKTFTFAAPANLTADKTVVFEVYSTSKSGIKGDVYTINATFKAASSDATLSMITIDGVPLAGFDPAKDEYSYGPFNYNLDGITVGYTTNDPNATASGDIGYQEIEMGKSKILTITVTAENGKTQKTYKINASRDVEDPYLSDIELSGQIGGILLKDEAGKEGFNPNTKVYYATVINTTSIVSVTASYDNSNYRVTSGAKLINSASKSREWETTELPEGKKTPVAITVAYGGKSVIYTVYITRLDKASMDTSISNITLKEVTMKGVSTSVGKDKFDYNQNIDSYELTVANKVSTIDFDVVLGNGGTPGGDTINVATWDSLNNTSLKIGKNDVFVLVTAADKVTKRVVHLVVTREAMEITVDKEAVEKNTLDVISETEYKYTLKLGKKKASSLTADQYKSYIKYDETKSDIEKNIVSNINDPNCNEVVIEVTDGTQSILVTIELQRTTATSLLDVSSASNLLLWLILLIAIILLIIILVSVNKDKYGNINKQRKRA